MTTHEKGMVTAALQAESEFLITAAIQRREAMRRQEQAFGAVVCLVCAIIISSVIIGAGFRRVSQMIDAAKQAEVRK